MSLISVTTSPAQITVVCYGRNPASQSGYCEQVRIVPLASLELGMSLSATDKNKDAISVAPCPMCNAQLVLMRVWEALPAEQEGEPFGLAYQRAHRRGVNALAKWLKDNNQKNADCAADIDAETGEPAEMTPLPVSAIPTAGIG